MVFVLVLTAAHHNADHWWFDF